MTSVRSRRSSGLVEVAVVQPKTKQPDPDHAAAGMEPDPDRVVAPPDQLVGQGQTGRPRPDDQNIEQVAVGCRHDRPGGGGSRRRW
jgi:hypothetical protein